MTAIRQQFGSEEEVANAFLETADMQTVKKKMNIKRLITVFVVAVITILCIGAIITVVGSRYSDARYTVYTEFLEESHSSDFTQEQYESNLN